MFPMRGGGAGATNLARALPMVCDAAGRRATSGTSMKCSSGSGVFSTTRGVQWIRAGKRMKPKAVRLRDGGTVMEHDPRLLPVVERIGRFRMYRDVEREKGVSVSVAGVLPEGGANIGSGIVSSADRRRIYMRELMRRKRRAKLDGAAGG